MLTLDISSHNLPAMHCESWFSCCCCGISVSALVIKMFTNLLNPTTACWPLARAKRKSKRGRPLPLHHAQADTHRHGEWNRAPAYTPECVCMARPVTKWNGSTYQFIVAFRGQASMKDARRFRFNFRLWLGLITIAANRNDRYDGHRWNAAGAAGAALATAEAEMPWTQVVHVQRVGF